MTTSSSSKVERDSQGRILPGQQSLNPKGRPKGQSLKEYWSGKFALMTDGEKEEFTKKVAPELIWQMAEGRPAQGMGQDPDLEPMKLLVSFLDERSRNEDT